MPFVPSFSSTQLYGQPTIAYVTDTSTGSDVLITARRAYFRTATGDYLVVSGTTTDYNAWALADTTEGFDLLPQDEAVVLVIDWVDAGGNVLYTAEDEILYKQNTEAMLLTLTKSQVSNPSIIYNTTYRSNKMWLFTLLKSAENAVEFGADIYSAQVNLNEAQNMITNESYFF
jgi:hypothetical protein